MVALASEHQQVKNVVIPGVSVFVVNDVPRLQGEHLADDVTRNPHPVLPTDIRPDIPARPCPEP